MSYGLAYGLSAFGLSKQLDHLAPARRSGLMDEYFARFGGVRDYLREVVAEARGDRLHRDDARPAPLPARPDRRQPAAPRDGRADGAQRARSRARPPTSSSWRCCGVDAALAEAGAALADPAPGPRRARPRGRARRARVGRGAGPQGDGRGDRDGRPARGQRRRRLAPGRTPATDPGAHPGSPPDRPTARLTGRPPVARTPTASTGVGERAPRAVGRRRRRTCAAARRRVRA